MQERMAQEAGDGRTALEAELAAIARQRADLTARRGRLLDLAASRGGNAPAVEVSLYSKQLETLATEESGLIGRAAEVRAALAVRDGAHVEVVRRVLAAVRVQLDARRHELMAKLAAALAEHGELLAAHAQVQHLASESLPVLVDRLRPPAAEPAPAA